MFHTTYKQISSYLLNKISSFTTLIKICTFIINFALKFAGIGTF